ncbi:MAG: flagellar hook-basal body complex protein [Pirellulales bacterium]|nr:flagellar hook-basal body complex protein [Pirellulales bacterium]
MSLTSALNTALTGMQAAETMIDVDGNNIANSNTVGFKSSTASFATQFLQTQGLGSSPTANSGGTNPRQIGMGTMIAEITPNFTQGTVEISSNSTDMAIQGDGFFIVQGQNGGQEYTRNGVFKLNSNNELVTSTGNRLLGYGVDQDFQIQSTQLVPITIPLGSVAVAKATENVELQGALTPNGIQADAAKIIQSGVLGDASYLRPETTSTSPKMDISLQATLPPAQAVASPTASSLVPGTYYYKVTFSDADPPIVPPEIPPLSTPSEGMPTTGVSATTDVANDAVTIPVNLLLNPSGYKFVNIYRSSTGNANDFRLLDTVAAAAAANPYIDDGGINNGGTPLATPLLNNASLSGTYDYHIAFVDSNGLVSRPSDVISGITPTNARVHLTNLPAPDPADPTAWTQYIIYRNYSVGGNQFVEVGRVNISDPLDPTYNPTYTDSVSDATLQDRAATDPTKILNFNGPPATAGTRLVDLISNTEGTSYPSLFASSGTLQFTGIKGGSTLATQQLTVVGSNPPAAVDTRVADLLDFMSESLGIQKRTGTNGIPQSIDTADPDNKGPYDPGASIVDGVVNIVGNNGTFNAVDISLSGLQFVTAGGKNTVNMPFTKYQDAIGESTMTDFLVYDSLGTACNVRITADLESVSETGTVYRWFADSSSNQTPTDSPTIAVGTGTITFDGKGKFVSATNDKVTIYRSGTPAVSPLVFKLDFLNISGLGEKSSALQMKSQDGSAPGKLSSFIVGEDGRITGVFSNSIKRDLGQIRLARFSNPAGLQQKGQNLYASGVNSGVPIEGNPGQQGIGSIIAGAVELSNTDIGGSLTDLILASTMYRGNARVITTTQQLFDELLALKR